MTERKFESGHALRAFRGAALITLAWLAGCSQIPAYQRPAAPVPQQFVADMPTTDTTTLPDWHTYFPDPALHTLIEAALANIRDMRIARARGGGARARAGGAR